MNDFVNPNNNIVEVCGFEIPSARILFVLTEIDRFDEYHKTGVWLEEFAIPYIKFIDRDFDVTVVTLNGKEAPVDPASDNLIDDIKWHKAKEVMKNPVPLDNINYCGYDAIVIPGGHGPLFDLACSDKLGEILIYFMENQKLIAAICHGPAAFVKAIKQGISVFKGFQLTALTNEEEKLAKTDGLVPFSIENDLTECGAHFVAAAPGEVNVVVDRNLITAQNHQSSHLFAEAICEYLDKLHIRKY